RKPGTGRTTPMFPATGSTITAAILPRLRSKICSTASRSLYAHESVSAVISAGELHDLVPPGERTGQTQRAHHRFRSRIDEPDQLHARHEAADQPGQLELQGAGRAEARAPGCRLRDRREDARVGVTEDER